MPTFEQILTKDHHTRRFEILTEPDGWRVVERADATVVRDAVYTDWHRVERARRVFAIETSTLRAEGWHESRAGQDPVPAGPDGSYSTKR